MLVVTTGRSALAIQRVIFQDPFDAAALLVGDARIINVVFISAVLASRMRDQLYGLMSGVKDKLAEVRGKKNQW